MTPRWTQFAAASLLLGSLGACGTLFTHTQVLAGTSNAKSTATATPGATASIPPPHKPVNPTPIPAQRTSITLPKPVVVIVGTKTLGTGLSVKAAFQLANNPKNLVSFLIVPPAHVPRNYILQYITVTPAQDQQTPAAAALTYIPAGLTKVGGTYPSVNLYKQLGQSLMVINPGGKVQTVTIRAGTKGIGVVKGQLVDMKFKSGLETVEISWQVNSVNYELTSVVSLSKLSIPELLATAGGFQ